MKRFIYLIFGITFFINQVNAQITITPATLEGDTGVGQSQDLDFTIEYTGAGNVNLQSMSTIGPDSLEFVAPSINPGAPLFPSNPVPFYITFTPTTTGVKSATLVIVTGGDEDSSYFVPLSGLAGVNPEQNIITSADTIDFGTANFGFPSIKEITIYNDGASDLIINGFDFRYNISFNNPYVNLDSNYTFPASIAYGDSLVYRIAFATDEVGADMPTNSIMKILSNDPQGDYDVVNLGMGTAPIIEVNPSIDYDTLTANITKDTTLKVKNNAAADGDITILGLDFSGDFASDFSSSTIFPITVTPGDSTSIDISFTPTTYGPISSTLSIFANDTQNISLDGDVTQNVMSISDTLRDSIEVSGAKFITISTIGGTDITITNAILGNASSGFEQPEFTIASGLSFPAVIEGGTVSNDLFVGFSAEPLPGLKEAEIIVYSDAISSPDTVIFQVQQTAAELSVNVDSIDFGDIFKGNNKDSIITITNTGDAIMRLTYVYIQNPHSTPFTVTDGDITSGFINIQPGADYNITVRALSNGEGPTNGILQIYTNNGGIANIPVQANILVPEISLSTALLDYGTVYNFQDSTKSFTITNTGAADLTIDDLVVIGSSQFSVVNATLPITIPPSAQTTVEVKLSPVYLGDHYPELYIWNNTVEGLKKLPMHALVGWSYLTSSLDDTINLGSVAVDTSDSKISGYILNQGGGSALPLTISGIEFTGPDADAFSTEGISFPFTLQPSQLKFLTLSFRPTEAKSYSATMQLISNHPSSNLTATVIGEGYDPPIIEVDYDEVVFPDLNIGEFVDRYIKVRNIGTQPLELYNKVINGSTIGFSLPLASINMTIPPMTEDSIRIQQGALEGGDLNQVLQIGSNDPFTPYTNIRLISSFYGPSIEVSEDTINFPDSVTVGGATDTIDIWVHNRGSGDLKLEYHKINLDASFYILYEGYAPPTQGTSYQLLLAPGDSIKTHVVFEPKSLGAIDTTTDISYRGSFNAFAELPITVSGIGKAPLELVVGGITLKADKIITTGPNTRTLRGNVFTEDLRFTGDVLVDLSNNTFEGTGDVFMRNIPEVGEYGGPEVALQEGGFDYTAHPTLAEMAVTAGFATTNTVFSLIGLPLEVNKFNLIPDGVIIGGKLNLPAELFGEGTGVNIDSLEITTTNGVRITGSVRLTELKVQNLVELNDVYIYFNTFENTFAGGGQIGFEVMEKGISIAAEVVIQKGGLESVEMEIEVDPGIPLATTGWELSGGNGFLKGLQEPPISMGLGVDLRPTVPVEVIKLDNLTISYKFATSLNGSGTVQLFGEDLAGGAIEISVEKVGIEVFLNLLEIFKGEAGLAMTFKDDKIGVNAAAKLEVTIPKPDPCPVCDWLPGILPRKIATADAYFQDNKLGANVTLHLVVDVSLGVLLTFENNSTKVEVGPNIEPLARSGKTSEEGVYSFTVDQASKNLFVKVTNDDLIPDANLVLTTGVEITPENAASMGIYHVENPEINGSMFILENAKAGEYQIKVNNAELFEVEVLASGYSPEIEIEDVSLNTTSGDLTISWSDDDPDSDAKVSLFYDIDQEGANGIPIVQGISEDDETDSYVWNTDSLKNGGYYVYAVIDDSSNTPIVNYYGTAFSINRPSPITVPTLSGTQDVDTIKLSWTPVVEAAKYYIYFDEDTVTFNSGNLRVDSALTYSIVDFTKGRDYQFAISAVTDNNVESNLSNIVALDFVSGSSNNAPEITNSSFVKTAKVDEQYAMTITYVDLDAGDSPYPWLVTSPEGMSMDEFGAITWTPSSDQVGQHQVIVVVGDDSSSIDTASYTITVFDNESATGILSTNGFSFNGSGQEVIVTLKDEGLNANTSVKDEVFVTVYSLEDPTGIQLKLTEQAPNQGTFKGTFTFGATSNASQQQIGVGEFDSVFVLYNDMDPMTDIEKYVLYETSETPNNFPTALSLNNTFIAEGTEVDDLIGLLSTTDADVSDTHIYDFVNGVGDGNNDLFSIVGESVKLAQSIENMTDSVFYIRVRVSDNKNGFYENSFELRNGYVSAVSESHLLYRMDIYPNPASRKLILELDNANEEDIEVSVVSLSGQKLISDTYSKSKSHAKVSLNVKDLESGTYFIQVRQGEELINKSFVKE